jgi:zinc protease
MNRIQETVRMAGKAATLSVLLWGGAAQAALPIQSWQHGSGARVYLVETRNLPMLDVQIDVDGGGRRDPQAQTGLASATAQLLSGGVREQGSLPALDENALVEAWADLGAQFGASATADRFSVSLRTLTEPAILRSAVQLAARQLAAPAFPEPVWQRDRARMVAGWQQAQTKPDTLAQRSFAQAVYSGHPYGREATPETWARIATPAMRAFYERHAQACRARVTLVGSVSRAEAETLVNDLLAGWQAHGCQPLPAVADVPALTQAQKLQQPFAAAQAQVLVGQPGIARSDPDFLTLIVGNHVFGGGGFTSRLMQEIREKRGLTYGVYSYFSPGLHAGAFTIGMQTRPDQAQQALDIIHSEIRRFVAEGPTEQELAEAKASLINGFALRLDSNRKLLDNVASVNWNDLPLDYLDRWTQLVGAITREQVRDALQRVIQPDRLVTVVVGAGS